MSIPPNLPSVFDLMTPVTQTQLRATFVNALVAVGIPADQWVQGGVFSSILTQFANIGASLSTVLSAGISAMFLDYAVGPWLVLLAYYQYGVTAIPATFASGQYTFTNAGGGLYTFAAGTLQLTNSATKQTYTNAQAFTLNPLSTLTINVVANQAGSIGTAAPGAIDTIVSVMIGVTGTNIAAVAGQDQEPDPALRIRCQAARALSSNGGPRMAYKAAIQAAINGSGNQVNINRVSVSPASSTGIVTVTCAAPSGAVTAEDLTAAALAIENLVRPTGVTVYVVSASAVNYSNALVVYAQALPGVTAAGIQALAEADLTAWFAAYPIGGLVTTGTGYVFASGINSVIGEASPAIYAVTGATDMALSTSQVADNATTITVNLVSPT